jgi:IS5 family transposase
MVTTAEGLPVEVSLTPGSYNDTKHLRTFELDLPEGSVLYGDKAYNEYFTEDLLAEASGIELLPHRKKTSKRPVEAYVEYVQQVYRKKIETGFIALKRLLPASIHAVADRGFELKVFLFVLACSIDALL